MDVNELTADELRELAEAKAQETALREIDVDGLIVHVDQGKCKSWKAFRIMSNVGADLDMNTLQTMIDFIELVTDVDEETIVAHCGGDDASLEAVIGTVARIVSECYPKN